MTTVRSSCKKMFGNLMTSVRSSSLQTVDGFETDTEFSEETVPSPYNARKEPTGV